MQAWMRIRAALAFVAASRTLRVLAGLLGAIGPVGCHRRTLPSTTPASRPVTRDLGELRGESSPTTWTCAGGMCPWGASLTGHALAWPAETRAVTTRLGYTVSPGIYLPAAKANGASIAIESGTARVHAGPPGDADHRSLATLTAGQTFHITGLAGREVLSVQADAPFTYRATLPPIRASDAGDRGGSGRVVPSTQALWRCNSARCSGGDWTGAVIAWPAGSAHQSNARSGDASRSVFSTDGAPLYPYMGRWAQGCKVTAESGVVQIIEWQRGTEVWRSTWLFPGDAHVIDLAPAEDGAMIETYDGSPGFSVSLSNCTPEPISQ